jgi:AcrR family transcriptional regulator
MAPDERRAALIAATIPLLQKHGLDVSTRQIAQAAGVAEGTIFGVFRDKNSLLVAALLQALDPQPTLDSLAAIDPSLDLRTRLIVAADLINDRFAAGAHLMGAARTLALATESHPDARNRMADTRRRLLASLTAVVAPDAARLRQSPDTAARLLLLFCGANTFGPFGDPTRFTGADMVSLLLDGLLVTPTDPDDLPILRFVAGSTDNEITGVP